LIAQHYGQIWVALLTMVLAAFYIGHVYFCLAYVDLGVAQVKVALKVTDPHSLHEFADSQFAVLSFVGHRMADDGRAVVEWASDCQSQANRVARANLLSLLFK
ncbi:MAG: hypothetical protein NHG36_05640, partial [Chromatiaceae bacterium]|nr:hypothetical protein [Candidatus Thioaporhodococcus sediminis]